MEEAMEGAHTADVTPASHYEAVEGAYTADVTSASRYEKLDGDGLADPVISSNANSELNNNLLAETPAQETNTLQAFCNICLAMFGAGAFALPWAFYKMGVVGAIITMIVFAGLTVLTVSWLVDVKNVTAASGIVNPSYVDCGRHALGAYGAAVIYAFTVLCSLGVCGAFLVFVSTNLWKIEPSITKDEWLLLLLIPVLPLTMLRSYARLSFMSMFGNCSLLTGMFAVLLFGFSDSSSSWPHMHMTYVKWSSFTEAFGSVAFLFCVDFLLLPIERSMSEPRKFTATMAASTTFVGVCCLAFALFGYIFFDERIDSNVISNLKTGGPHGIFANIVRVSLSISLIFSYLLVLAPGVEIMERSMLSDATSHKFMKQNAVRAVMVLVTVGLATLGKSFGLMTNLVGGVCMNSLAFVFPPLMSLILLKSQQNFLQRLCRVAIIVLGIVVAVLVVIVSIKNYNN